MMSRQAFMEDLPMVFGYQMTIESLRFELEKMRNGMMGRHLLLMMLFLRSATTKKKGTQVFELLSPILIV